MPAAGAAARAASCASSGSSAGSGSHPGSGSWRASSTGGTAVGPTAAPISEGSGRHAGTDSVSGSREGGSSTTGPAAGPAGASDSNGRAGASSAGAEYRLATRRGTTSPGWPDAGAIVGAGDSSGVGSAQSGRLRSTLGCKTDREGCLFLGTRVLPVGLRRSASRLAEARSGSQSIAGRRPEGLPRCTPRSPL